MPKLIDPIKYHVAVRELRDFFDMKGYFEVPTQSRLSILAACEDPRTIATFNYAGNVWPLPQTGQMWLEYELLSNPKVKGFYCISTSFRNEPNPIEGRHDLIFPMFEFETHGDMNDLIKLEKELCFYLGFGAIAELQYRRMSKQYGVDILEAEHEKLMQEEFGNVVLLKYFPTNTSPFWNMKQSHGDACKVDVIIHGMETIGSAERSTDEDEMRDQFHTISEGMYADILFAQFGKDRVETELENFLAFDFFPRIGGGIGLTRLIRGLELNDA